MSTLSSPSYFLDPPLSFQSSKRSTNKSVIAQIEAIVEGIFDGFFDGGNTHSVRLKVKTCTNRSRASTHSDGNIPYIIRCVNYPGTTAQEAWRFTVILRILELIHEALINNVTISKRSIYYKDTKLFKQQSTVDRYVDILAFTLGVQRADLNVVAVAKGLVIGCFILFLKDGGSTNGILESKPLLLPEISTVASVSAPSACWILVVEKDSAFQALATTNFHRVCAAGPGIMITGKGYPDISTRAFLHTLSFAPSCPPIYALVDLDPDGIAIMSTYKHGSFTLSHENKSLVVPEICWLGPKNEDMCAKDEEEEKGLLRLTGRDRRKAVGLLVSMDKEVEWMRELQVLLMLGFKAEIEILSERTGGLDGWVERRLCEKLLGEANSICMRIAKGGAIEETLVDESVLQESSLEDTLINGLVEEASTANTVRKETFERMINPKDFEENLITQTQRKKSEGKRPLARHATEELINDDDFVERTITCTLRKQLEGEQPWMENWTEDWVNEEDCSQTLIARTLVNDQVGERASGKSSIDDGMNDEEFDDIMAEALWQNPAEQKQGYTNDWEDEDMLEDMLGEGTGMNLDEDEEDLLTMLG